MKVSHAPVSAHHIDREFRPALNTWPFARAAPPRRVRDPLREIVLPKFDNVRPSGGGFTVHCPAHDDREASLSINRGTTHPVLFCCHAGCDTDSILSALDITWADILNPTDRPGSAGDDTWMPCGHVKVAEYLYRDAGNTVVFAVARCNLKGNGCQGFRQWRPDPGSGSGKRWSRNLPDGTRVGEGLVYRLPDVLDFDANRNVYIVEGEKDADRLWSMRVPATCNAQGAGKWTPAHADWLVGRDIVVVADRDEAGWRHAESVTNTLLELANSIEIVRAAEGKDVSCHLDAGLTLAGLITVATPKDQPPVTEFGPTA